MKSDIPDFLDILLDRFGKSPDNPMIPRKGMTTYQLIKCMEHNAKLIKKEQKI